MITIIQGNVGRGSAAHDILLSHKADIILVQEPWVKHDLRLTKTHPRYRLFGPVTNWEQRPRALTYVRTDLAAHLLPFPSSPDCVAVEADGLTVINVYRPPGDPRGGLLDSLTSLQLPRNTIVAGDFNTYHPTWQTSRGASAGGNRLCDELELRSSIMIEVRNRLGIHTHHLDTAPTLRRHRPDLATAPP